MTREEIVGGLMGILDALRDMGLMKPFSKTEECLRGAIAALRGPEWVRTADRLPERMELLPCSVRVLINSFMGVVTAQYDFEDGVWIDFFIHKHSPFSRPNYYDKSMVVTHWMPLPKLPEVEG